jgi:DNA-binding NtrC family response regulator
VSSNSVPRVFVVDDKHVIASTLATILKRQGYSARAFTSPLEALAAARSGAPDLLISDGLSGVDLANQVKAQYPECKVLLFSTRPTQGCPPSGNLPSAVLSVMEAATGALATEADSIHSHGP